LLFLVEKNGSIVTKEEILNSVWDDKFVEESNLVVQISNLRKALGEAKGSPRFLITVPGKGYKFAGEIDQYDGSFAVETHTFAKLTIENELDSDSSILKAKPFVVSKIKSLVIGFAMLFTFVGVFWFWDYSFKSQNNTSNNNISPNSVAVLPFQLLNSHSQNSDELELGLTEALINRLSGSNQLSVRPISSVRKYSGDNRDLKKIAKELRVDSILEGNIQLDGNRIRLTLNLVRSSDGLSIWNEKIDENLADIFIIQDRISSKISSSLKLILTDKEKLAFSKVYTKNVDAYRKYLVGRNNWNKRTLEGFSESIKYYNEAIELDTKFALAYAGLAETYLLQGLFGITPTVEAFPKVTTFAEKALSIDPDLGEAYVSLAMIENLHNYNWYQAETNFRRAIELKPSYSTARHWFGLFLAMQGKTAEAISELSKAETLDPNSTSIQSDIAFAYYLGKQPDRAIERLKKTIDSNPEFANAHNLLGMSYLSMNLFDEAKEEFTKAAELSKGNIGNIELIWANAFAGNRIEAQNLSENLPKDKIVSHFDQALIQTSLGRKDEAISSLFSAFETKDPLIVPVKVFPPFESLRNEARFIELLEKMNLK
jgi:TolB-like protein/DNA-binding winged helix-turn-helix (wHTH) protein/thioredoxin-like negative regulator of GroEL